MVINRQAVFSEDGKYRYVLSRDWGTGRRLTWVMLNPSRADATADDHTIRKCLRYTQSWGYSGLVVVNLFAYISSAPYKLRLASDPIGPENDEYLAKYLKVADRCLVAWGAVADLPFMAERIRQVTPLLPAEAFCLGYTKKGWPRHPSRTALDLPPRRYDSQYNCRDEE